MLDQFKLGVDTLKRIREESGVTVEAVDQVMDDLQDALLDQREIDDAISSGQEQLNPADEAELEEELAQLVGASLSEAPIAAAAAAAASSTPVRQAQQPREQQAATDVSLANLLADLPSVQHLPDPSAAGSAEKLKLKLKQKQEDDDLPDPNSLQFAS
jgi:hypothetical protein